MDTSEMQVPLKGVVKIFKAGLQSKTWDIHGMPHFITTTHHEGCDMCKAYALYIVEASRALTVEILSREVKKAFQIAWLNIVCQIEDEAFSESDKKMEWYSDCHNNLMDDVRLVEEKAFTERVHCQKADEKLAQANSKIEELEAKLVSLQKQDNRTPIDWGDPYDFSDSESEPASGRSSQKRKKREAFPPSIQYGGFFPDEASTSVLVDEQMLVMPASTQAVGLSIAPLQEPPPTSRIAPP